MPIVLNIIEDVLGQGLAGDAASLAFSGLTKAGRFFYGREIEGIARATGMPVGKIALMQIAYEVFAACTSIIVEVDGASFGGASGSRATPFHIRTMDWPMEGLQELAVEVDFVRSGRIVCSASTWVGYVGVLTGLRSGAYSLSVNYRRTERGDRDMLSGILKNMLRGLASSWPVSFLVRDVLENVETYDEALPALRLSELMAPTYITIAGARPGQGAVVTRARSPKAVLPAWELAKQGPIVQTNHDWFADDDEAVAAAGADAGVAANISGSFERAAMARAAIRSMEAANGGGGGGVGGGGGIGHCSPRDLWLLLSTSPCCAEDTVYTTAMHPASGTLITRARTTEAHEQMGMARWGRLAREIEEDAGDDDDGEHASYR